VATVASRREGGIAAQRINGFPAAQIEVAHAKVRVLGNLQRFPQGWQEVKSDVVKDARHGCFV
jgi:hypothetical protein